MKTIEICLTINEFDALKRGYNKCVNILSDEPTEASDLVLVKIEYSSESMLAVALINVGRLLESEGAS